MQIIGVTIGGALSRLASQQEASQEKLIQFIKQHQGYDKILV
jgi:hypothetical protein